MKKRNKERDSTTPLPNHGSIQRKKNSTTKEKRAKTKYILFK
jgi:hypothetical protein